VARPVEVLNHGEVEKHCLDKESRLRLYRIQELSEADELDYHEDVDHLAFIAAQEHHRLKQDAYNNEQSVLYWQPSLHKLQQQHTKG